MPTAAVSTSARGRAETLAAHLDTHMLSAGEVEVEGRGPRLQGFPALYQCLQLKPAWMAQSGDALTATSSLTAFSMIRPDPNSHRTPRLA